MDAKKRAKKADGKKAPAKKSSAKKGDPAKAAKKKAAARLYDADDLDGIKAPPATSPKRPPSNSPPDMLDITEISEELEALKVKLEEYAAHLRALDRKRLNGIGIKNRGSFHLKTPSFMAMP